MKKNTARGIPWRTIAAMAVVGALAILLAWRLESNPRLNGSARDTESALRISEVMSDTDDVSVDWIEIENAGETEISLYGYALVNAAEPKRRLYSQAARLRRANIWWYSRTERTQPKGTALFTRRSGCPPAARRFTF